MTARETPLMRSIKYELTREKRCLIWRNNVGEGHTLDGRYITFGLGNGSPDLVGIYKGQFIGIEVKGKRGVVSDDQRSWHAIATQHGARIVTARSIEEALECLK